jgi:DNA-binding MarR family transcriptional regulator
MKRNTVTASSRSENLGIVDGLVQLSFLVQNAMTQTAGRFEISLLQGRLLGVLRDREPTMAELARLLDLDKSSATGLIDRAELRGLVSRRKVAGDGRALHVALTRQGRDLARAFVADVTAAILSLTDGLTPTNRHRLSQTASAVVRRHAAAHGLDLTAGITSRPDVREMKKAI